MIDVAAIGELLIDFTPGEGEWSFVAHPGGSVANFLAQIAVLGKKTAFMGMVGRDQFGEYLHDTLKTVGVGTQGLKMNPDVGTTLAFVHINAQGDRSFTFYRRPGADMMFTDQDIDYGVIDEAPFFHFAGVSLTKEPMRQATFTAVTYAKERGKVISFDPNYRWNLWDDEETAIEVLRRGVPLCDLIKVSDEEALMITGKQTVEEAAAELMKMGPQLVLVTLGAKGCNCYHKNLSAHFDTYDTKVVDTTGSGDSFFGAVVSRLSEIKTPIDRLTAEQLADMVEFGNAAGSCCAAGYGAIPSLCGEEKIRRCMESVPKLCLYKEREYASF